MNNSRTIVVESGDVRHIGDVVEHEDEANQKWEKSAIETVDVGSNTDWNSYLVYDSEKNIQSAQYVVLKCLFELSVACILVPLSSEVNNKHQNSDRNNTQL